jgi:hypothetical protein
VTVIAIATLRSDPCDGTGFTSEAFGYCLSIVVRDEVGWRITLNDTEDEFEGSAARFEQMLDSWRFR